MPDPRTQPHRPPAPPLLHPVRVARLDPEGGEANAVRLVPDAEARARIARFLDIERLDRLALTGALAPVAGGWEFRGQLTAKAVQACRVTLAPLAETIDTPVRRRYLRDLPVPQEDERVLGEDDMDPPEPLGAEIDLGQLAVETLALALDPWPRAEDAALEPPEGADPAEETSERPFAALARLRDKRPSDTD
ncbi:MAG TPA: DUF177 domain-containing protein [Thermohalobaculum sp.]|nr:DUF177 domain-containing protein [Thermohalobaculum sp.]